jgi:alkylation response protein AidB-like acyl-CoA dehydrogenase
MEWPFSSRQRQIAAIADEIGREVLEPNAEELDRTGLYPRANLLHTARAGLNSLLLPERYGGLGLDHGAYALATHTLARYCPSTTMVFVMHTAAVQTVNLAGNEEQRQRLLPSAREGMLGTLAFSEPATGSHFWYCVSQARRDGAGYVLEKDASFVTSAGEADWYVVQTRTPDSADPSDMIYLLVYNGQPGVWAGRWRALGMNGNASGPMRFRDVRVAAEDRIGAEGAGAYWNDNVVDPIFLLGSSACWAGIARGALDRAVAHATTRVHADVGKRVADYQLMRHYLARCNILVSSAEALLFRAAQRLDELTAAGRPHAEMLFDLWELKVHAADVVIEVTNIALQVAGGLGFKSGPIERALRDGRAGAVMGPSNEMCREWIGLTLVGRPVEYWPTAEKLELRDDAPTPVEAS